MKPSTHPKLTGRLDYFKKVSLFRDLSERQIGRLMHIMSLVEYSEDEVVFKEGSSGDSIYILIEGEVEISKTLVLPQWIQSAQKKEKSLIRLSEKAHPFFGEMAMFGQDAERSATITATKTCLMAMLPGKEFQAILEADPEIGLVVYRNIACELAKRVREANKNVLKLTTAFTLALEG